MGQQPSKKAKKATKDKEKEKDIASDSGYNDSKDAPNENTAQDSTSHGTSDTVTSDIPNGTPAINIVPNSAGAATPSFNNHIIPGSPYPTTQGGPPDADPSTTSPSPLHSSEPSATLDVPVTHTILSNANPFSPSSVISNSNGIAGELATNGASKERLKQLDVDDMIQRLLDVGYTGKVSKSLCLKNTEITAICLAARDVFLSQPTLVELSPPVKIVGDVHGQYSDLIRLFEMCGFPPAANYLFLGDYVDRGKQSLETILLLLCYKIKYPENFFLLRGNHECANVTRGELIFSSAPMISHLHIVYGFYDECKRRCNIKTWKTFIDVFNCLPIAAIVASKIFCVHGGLSPSLHSMDDIKRIQRPTDVPDYGLLNDLLWSDPSDTALDWEDNERGVSYCFGKAIINEFLARYDMDLICRAHMVVEDGYEFWNDRTLVTVFSAPNYCGGKALFSDHLCKRLK